MMLCKPEKTVQCTTHLLHIKPHFLFFSDKQLTGSVSQSMLFV